MNFKDRQAIGLLTQALYEKEQGDTESFEATIKTMLKDLGLKHLIHPEHLRRQGFDT